MIKLETDLVEKQIYRGQGNEKAKFINKQW